MIKIIIKLHRLIWLTQRFEWAPYDNAIDPLARDNSSMTTQWSK